jgi:hypothetical protein
MSYEDDRIRHKNRAQVAPAIQSVKAETFTLDLSPDCSLSHMLASLKDSGFYVELSEDGKTIHVG